MSCRVKDSIVDHMLKEGLIGKTPSGIYEVKGTDAAFDAENDILREMLYETYGVIGTPLIRETARKTYIKKTTSGGKVNLVRFNKAILDKAQKVYEEQLAEGEYSHSKDVKESMEKLSCEIETVRR